MHRKLCYHPVTLISEWIGYRRTRLLLVVVQIWETQYRNQIGLPCSPVVMCSRLQCYYQVAMPT